jgi:phage virion morphogenesis protein
VNGLVDFQNRLGHLIGNLSPTAVRQLAASAAKRLRASQQQNIKRQQSPDGTPFKPRKEQRLRGKRGRVKREMFAKLRTAKYLKAKGVNGDAVVEFAGSVQRMALVHHYGLRDRPSRGAKATPYEARPLLGISDADRLTIEDEITRYLSL